MQLTNLYDILCYGLPTHGRPAVVPQGFCKRCAEAVRARNRELLRNTLGPCTKKGNLYLTRLVSPALGLNCGWSHSQRTLSAAVKPIGLVSSHPMLVTHIRGTQEDAATHCRMTGVIVIP